MNRTLVFCTIGMLGSLACFDAKNGSDDDVGDEATDSSGDSTDAATEESGTDDASSDTDDESSDGDTTSDTTAGETDTTDEADTMDDSSPDSDQDGFLDVVDNCPEDPNPNQLDFDGDGQGNVCDLMVYTTIGGSLESEIEIGSAFNNCNIPVDLVPIGGTVQVQLDDDAALVRIELTELQIEDVDGQCQLLLQNTSVSFTDFVIENGGGPFPVSFAHGQAAHDAGTASGSTMPHPIVTSGTFEASSQGDPPTSMPLELQDAELPAMNVDIAGAGAAMSLTWNSNADIGTLMFMIENPLPLDVTMTLTGLDGTLVLAP